MRRCLLGLVLLVSFLYGAACAPTGWTFGPVFSCKKTGWFAKRPHIVERGGEYYLAWVYGKDAFAFSPSSKVMDGRLVFTLQAMTSSGKVPGRYAEQRIDGAEKIAALRRGGAYWWEPDKSFVKLEVVASSSPAS